MLKNASLYYLHTALTDSSKLPSLLKFNVTEGRTTVC